MRIISRQDGVTTVEFAIIGLLFFIILFGIIEMGRALFVWNSLADITRRSARIAAVCQPNDLRVVRTAIYNAGGDGDSSDLISGLVASHVKVEYLDSAFVLVPDPKNAGFSSVEYVRASIDGYKHQMFIPTLNVELTPPKFTTTVPAESLGRWEDAAGNVYNGCNFP